MILVGYMKTWRERRTFRNLEKETIHFHQDPDEIEQLYKLMKKSFTQTKMITNSQLATTMTFSRMA